MNNNTEMNAVSKTAFFCCGVRAEDAKSGRSICADIYADEFMTDEGRAIFSMFSNSPKQNISNVVRSRIIQDEIAARLKLNKNLQVVNIGAGFDSRAYRLAGGRWFEFDEAPVINHKESMLPSSACANPLQRYAVDFGRGELSELMKACDPDAETLVVIEGVFMYLDKGLIKDLLETLRGYFKNHVLICDLMNKRFFEKHMGTAYDRILQLGSEYRFIEDCPEAVFESNGYKALTEPVSVVGRSREFNAIYVPAILLKTALKSLRDGYRIHTFMAV